MASVPEHWPLLPASFPRVCRNLPSILTHWVYVLSVAFKFLGGLMSTCVGPFMVPASFLLTEMLLHNLLSGIGSNLSTAGNPHVGQQTSGAAKLPKQFCRFLSLWLLWWLTLSKWHTLVTVSPFLSGGDFSGGFGLLDLCFVGLNGLSVLTIWKLSVSLVRAQTGKSLLVWGCQVSCTHKLD